MTPNQMHTVHAKINKTDVNVSLKTIKVLEDNKHINIHDFEFDNGFLDMTQTMKEKLGKLNIRNKNFWSSKDTTKKIKR
jgi:hypothetical protein